MKLLFLDDERNVEDVTWVKYPEGLEQIVVRNYKEFMDAVTKLHPSEISSTVFSFDHDLQDFNEAGIEFTGLTCATHMIDYFEAMVSNIKVVCLVSLIHKTLVVVRTSKIS